MRERFFNNHKLIPHRLDYKFFVPVLALVMIVSSALPTMSVNAQPASSISSDITSLEQCIEKFQGSDTTYCGSSYPLQVAKSGQNCDNRPYIGRRTWRSGHCQVQYYSLTCKPPTHSPSGP